MKLASIEKILEVAHHSNADTLDIVKVLGYQCIVKRDQYKVGELIVFIQPDTVLPDKEWAAFYKAKSSRVKAVKLRGSWSMGIVESLGIVPTVEIERMNAFSGTVVGGLEGADVADILGVTKYEPPIPQDLDAKGPLPTGLGKTDEERYQNLDAIPYGEVVDVTLKIDGSSMTVFCKEVAAQLETSDWSSHYHIGITTRSMELKTECVNKYTTIAKEKDLVAKLKDYCVKHKVSLALRGEMYGNGIQKMSINPHSSKPLGFALFSVYNFNTLQYEGIESPHYYVKVAEALGIETVPMIEKDVVLTPELIKKYDEGIDNINGVPFEGVVVKMKGGKSFKIINKHYDSKK